MAQEPYTLTLPAPLAADLVTPLYEYFQAPLGLLPGTSWHGHSC